MAKNRTKRRKQKGRLKRWSQLGYVNTGHDPGHQLSLEARHRAKGLSIDAKEMAYLDAKYPSANQISPRRQAVLDRIRELGLEEPSIQHLVLSTHTFGYTKLLFQGPRFFFVKENTVKKEVRCSIVYTTYDRAIEVYNNGQIRWIAMSGLDME